MKRRIVNYGCSHAFGVEIAGRGEIYHPDNIRLNFGNLDATGHRVLSEFIKDKLKEILNAD